MRDLNGFFSHSKPRRARRLIALKKKKQQKQNNKKRAKPKIQKEKKIIVSHVHCIFHRQTNRLTILWENLAAAQ